MTDAAVHAVNPGIGGEVRLSGRKICKSSSATTRTKLSKRRKSSIDPRSCRIPTSSSLRTASRRSHSVTERQSRYSATPTFSTPGSPPHSGPSPHSAGPTKPSNTTPFALSLSKGRPFLQALRPKNKAMLRQAQHERIWGLERIQRVRKTCSPATTPTIC